MVDLLRPPSTTSRGSGAGVAWASLYGSIALDAGQVFALDYSDGFSNPVLVATAAVGLFVQLYLFAIALQRITPAVAIGMFGLGTAAVAVISIGWLGEPLTPLKAVALLAVIVGAVLLSTEQHNVKAAPPRKRHRKNEGEDEPPRGLGQRTG